ncbi:MAG TPA: class I SAM-dependent methyltransferase [Thermoanaerobaculia bacterium]|nr:class I SAM-dependent methyltransferase [Thermoanaerobaculia bacterium]
MAFEVLQTRQQVEEARANLEKRGVSCAGIELSRRTLWQRIRGAPPSTLGDLRKSWDVLRTAEFIEQHHPKAARVLDIGAYNSEMLCVLHRLGFERLTGIDLNAAIRQMPYRESIRWEVGDFLRTPFPDRAFDVITSISVIEHGFDAPALLAEMSRLLDPGGSFVASFDYWPDKIDTSDTKFFGMDWLIFSREEVQTFIREASDFGFVSEGALDMRANERPVRCADREYTFAWLVLKKR